MKPLNTNAIHCAKCKPNKGCNGKRFTKKYKTRKDNRHIELK